MPTPPPTTTTEALALLDRLAQAGPGTVTLAGPLTLGQALAHVAQGVRCSLDGYPQHKPRWFQATLGRLVLRRFLRAGRMGHDLGAPIPGLPPPSPDTDPTAALAELRAALLAFQGHAGPCAPHFAYGPVTHGEYDRLHAMHLVDHLRGWQGT